MERKMKKIQNKRMIFLEKGFLVFLLTFLIFNSGKSNNDSLFKTRDTKIYYNSSIISKIQKEKIFSYFKKTLLKEGTYQQIKKTHGAYYKKYVNDLIIANANDTLDLTDNKLDTSKPIFKMNYLAVDGDYILLSLSAKCKYECNYYFLFKYNGENFQEAVIISDVPSGKIADVRTINNLLYLNKLRRIVIK